MAAPVPEDAYEVPLGVGRIAREALQEDRIESGRQQLSLVDLFREHGAYGYRDGVITEARAGSG